MRWFGCLLWFLASMAYAAPLKVVTSFSILADWARVVGGAEVSVVSLVGPDQDMHAWQATPAASRAIIGADLLVVNGLGFDDAVLRMARASNFRGRLLVASQGITPRPAHAGHDHDEHEHGAVDPHAWQNIALVPVYIRNLEQALAARDPAHAAAYAARAQQYRQALASVEAWAAQAFNRLKPAQRRALISHDAFGYLAARFGLTLIPVQGVTGEGDTSAQGMAQLIRQIRATGLKAIFLENVANRRFVEQLAAETGVSVGGALYSDALSAAGGPAADYLGFYRHNVSTLLAGMQKN